MARYALAAPGTWSYYERPATTDRRELRFISLLQRSP